MNKIEKHIAPQFDVTIESYNDQFKGIGYKGNYKITIDKTLPGEVVAVRYDPQRPPKDRIVLEKLLKKSKLRVQPPCSFFETCGGCQLQHVEYQTQLAMKHHLMKEKQQDYPLMHHIKIHTPQGMENHFHYRNKAQIPFQRQEEHVIYGLYRKGTHQIISIDQCLVENRDANLILNVVKNWAETFRVPVYQEKSRQGSLRYVVIRKGQFTNQIMVILVSATPSLPHLRELLQELKQKIFSLKSVIINHNPSRSNVILGVKNQVVWGDSFIEERLRTLQFKIYPNTFFQINSIQMIHIIDKIRSHAGFDSQQQVLELYCGTGSIGLLIADQVKSVIGIDNNVSSIEAAQENMKLNEINNISFRTMNLESEKRINLPADFSPDVVIVDPPRKGLSDNLIREIVRLKPARVIYLSCNPATLFPNLSVLMKSGYHGEEIFLYDMFPHTSHIESLVFLNK